jgi:hypothetical protein
MFPEMLASAYESTWRQNPVDHSHPYRRGNVDLSTFVTSEQIWMQCHKSININASSISPSTRATLWHVILSSATAKLTEPQVRLTYMNLLRKTPVLETKFKRRKYKRLRWAPLCGVQCNPHCYISAYLSAIPLTVSYLCLNIFSGSFRDVTLQTLCLCFLSLPFDMLYSKIQSFYVITFPASRRI